MSAAGLRRGWAAGALSALTLAPLPAAPPADTLAALAEGNRLVHAGQLEEARIAYAAGLQGGDGGLDAEEGFLAYNLGTVAHRLGQLPEAVLWYRRAQTALPPGDRDLEENLELARRGLEALGVRPADPPPLWGAWLEHRRWHRRSALLGVVLAWAGLLLLAAPRRWRRLLAPVAALSCAAFAAGVFLPRFGPRAAVLLEQCPPEGPGLPAGTEVWVAPPEGGGSGDWRVLGELGRPLCPGSAVALVEP